MKYLLPLLVVVLVVLHQDYWQWDNTTLVFGFIPYSLLYHACISIATAIVWLLIVQFCWPDELDQVEPEEGADPL